MILEFASEISSSPNYNTKNKFEGTHMSILQRVQNRKKFDEVMKDGERVTVQSLRLGMVVAIDLQAQLSEMPETNGEI